METKRNNIVDRQPTGNFKLYYKSNEVLQLPEPFVRDFENDPKMIRKYFRDMLVRFNNTLRPGERSRNFVKVEREHILTFKSGIKKSRFLRV